MTSAPDGPGAVLTTGAAREVLRGGAALVHDRRLACPVEHRRAVRPCLRVPDPLGVRVAVEVGVDRILLQPPASPLSFRCALAIFSASGLLSPSHTPVARR